MQLRFASWVGEEVVCDLPTEDSPQATQLIDAAATEIALEYGVRRRAKIGAAHSVKWLRPLAYQLISACLDRDLTHLLHRRSLQANRYERGDVSSPNPFQLGLMAIFAQDEFFVKEDRYELGQVLWYAYRHYVPACFVNGFAIQVGPMTKQRSENSIEPEFSSWIIERRVMDIRSNNPRGAYPDHIERGVQRLRSESAGVLAPIFEALAEMQSDEFD